MSNTNTPQHLDNNVQDGNEEHNNEEHQEEQDPGARIEQLERSVQSLESGIGSILQMLQQQASKEDSREQEKERSGSSVCACVVSMERWSQHRAWFRIKSQDTHAGRATVLWFFSAPRHGWCFG
jgi:hypothetical protein